MTTPATGLPANSNSMAIKDQDFEIYQGNNKLLICDVENVADLTGCTITWACAKRTAKTTVVLQKEGTVLTEYPTKFSVAFVAADTNSISIGEYYYEVKIVDTDNIAVTVATGKMIVLPTLIKEEEEP